MKINSTYHGLNFISGMGAQVNETVSKRNGFLPNTSDRAPTSGALRNDNIPCTQHKDQCYMHEYRIMKIL